MKLIWHFCHWKVGSISSLLESGLAYDCFDIEIQWRDATSFLEIAFKGRGGPCLDVFTQEMPCKRHDHCIEENLRSGPETTWMEPCTHRSLTFHLSPPRYQACEGSLCGQPGPAPTDVSRIHLTPERQENSQTSWLSDPQHHVI